VAEQKRVHLVECDLMPPVQSAYHQGHSTETALVKVIDDIINAADDQNVTLLGPLALHSTLSTIRSRGCGADMEQPVEISHIVIFTGVL